MMVILLMMMMVVIQHIPTRRESDIMKGGNMAKSNSHHTLDTSAFPPGMNMPVGNYYDDTLRGCDDDTCVHCQLWWFSICPDHFFHSHRCVWWSLYCTPPPLPIITLAYLIYIFLRIKFKPLWKTTKKHAGNLFSKWSFLHDFLITSTLLFLHHSLHTILHNNQGGK